jgi:magnesium chelatase subunit D
VSPWADATLAAALFAVDPAGSGGVALRAPAGPVRERWLAMLGAALPAPPRKLPQSIRDERLLGGLDLPATLRAGKPVAQRGLLAETHGGVVLVPMAERLPPATAARLTAAIDRGEVRIERDGIAITHAARFGVVAFDEGQGDDDPLSPSLMDRMAFHLDLREVAPREAEPLAFGELADARAMLPTVACSDEILQALCAASAALGIASFRATMLALHVARLHAALHGKDEVDADDAAAAARLVLAPRATTVPSGPEEAGEDEEPPPPQPEEGETPPPESSADEPENEPPPNDGPLDDRVLEAAVAALPPALLARLQLEQLARERTRATGKSGALNKAGHRGRPFGVRRGEPRGGQRLNIIETLRAAAPWQKLRGAQRPRIEVRVDDFHVTRYRQRRQTTTIFVVDASGSSAIHRLAEAKGAVELLLADCYVRRDSVAVLAFRGRTAELLLPPTRSLVRAKRSLAALPGGGGTPLATAIDAANALADAIRRKGDTPLVVLLTDGRGNVALDGSGGRAQAEADATAAARRLRASGATVLLIDTSPKPYPQAARLAAEMQAAYLPLPHAGAQALSQVVRAGGR